MKTKFKFIVSFTFLCVFLSNGQNSNHKNINNNWVFGIGAGVNFSNGNGDLVAFETNINVVEGSASISDRNGQLLFYTDGKTVWNKEGNEMPNGNNLSGSDIGTFAQGVIILPYPNRVNEYLIFTTNDETPNSIVAYSKVSMQLDNGFGDVVINEKNIALENGDGNTSWDYSIESITSVNNSDENYWVLIPYNETLLAYKVSNSGVDTVPIVSTINSVAITEDNPTINAIKVSPDTSLLGIAETVNNKATIYNFNVNEGTVEGSPLVIFNAERGFYSLAFTDDSSKVWFSASLGHKLYGFDLNNLQNPPVVFFEDSDDYSFSTIQKGIDGKLYFNTSFGTRLGTINNYNDLNSVSITLDAFSLEGNRGRLGLPQLVPLLKRVSENCIPSIVLSSPETNNSFLYEASDYIETNGNYKISANQDIAFKAGNYVEMLPGTEVMENSVFEATIEDCVMLRKNKRKKNSKTQYVYLDSGNNPDTLLYEDQMSIYPNPASDHLNILVPESMLNKELIVEVYDLLGKRILRKNINKFKSSLNIYKWNRGVYVIKLSSKEESFSLTKRFMKL